LYRHFTRRLNFDSCAKKNSGDDNYVELKPLAVSRRTLLQSAGAGFAYLALAGLLGAADKSAVKPLNPKQPHFPAKAKRIIFLFMEGAMSSVDAFEYKPELQNSDGKSGPGGGALTASKFQFKQFGESRSWFLQPRLVGKKQVAH
jgi:hypothetical protein